MNRNELLKQLDELADGLRDYKYEYDAGLIRQAIDEIKRLDREIEKLLGKGR